MGEGGNTQVTFSSLKGFKDILPRETPVWQRVETVARGLLEAYGFEEIRTPALEQTELFKRGIGEETDIVSKEMYSLEDSRGRGLTLRPEATAGVVRAYIQHRLYEAYPIQKLYTIGPMFRHERPQKGRFRQFHQINAECFGDEGPRSDADIIVLAMALFDALHLTEVSLKLNSLGCPDCRPTYREQLKNHLAMKTDRLCEDCQRRSQYNPLRVFDCKAEPCREALKGAPTIPDFLCGACKDHFEAVRSFLDGVHLAYDLDGHLVRGLDYYNRTTFEIQTGLLGAQNAVAGGGRYDGLVRLLGGPDHPAMGFAVGMERLTALIQEQETLEDRETDLFVVSLGQEADLRAFPWIRALRKQGWRVEVDYAGRGLKSQMKKAGRLAASKVLILGEEELRSQKAVLRNMKTGEQTTLDMAEMVPVLQQVLTS